MCGRFQAVVAVGVTAMTMTFTPALLEQARRNAQRLAKAQNLKTFEAQDQIAQSKGFKNWSLLAKRCNASTTPPVAAPMQPATKVRWYAHGDCYEEDRTLYYCSMCDIFASPDHFATQHRRSHAEQLQIKLQAYAKWPADTARRSYRPADAHNLFTAELAALVAQQKARAASRSRFYRWLEKQASRDDPVGDLAYDITHDKGFPIEASLRQTRSYLQSKWVSEAVMDALAQAWLEFSANK